MGRSIARIALAMILIAAVPPAYAADPAQPQAAPASKKPVVKADTKKVKPAAKPETAKSQKAKSEKAANRAATAKPSPAPAAPVPPPAPPPPAVQPAKPADAKPTVHFAALRSEKVNLRSGPGENFPIQWVYVRRGLPVEVVATFDIWRKIKDSEGTEGWVNQQMLSGRRSVLVAGAVRDLRHDPKPDAEVVAKLEAGVVASVAKCNPDWCEVKAGGYKGWLMRGDVWGLEPGEVIE
ncbi:MAG TPA: SH3 domain-containing protein [Alphaproteobacteria bacterium]|nr:SH3 domain-containing protein [Alphaproteobacteria bacterium]